MKLALLLAAVDPAVGGVLIRGERGTAKSTIVRGLARVLPPRSVVVGCRYGCAPTDTTLCPECLSRQLATDPLPTELRSTRVVELPLGASEDRVVGSLDMEAALKAGSRAFQPGLLAEANGEILYVDEVNLLDHHLVDVLLDAAAMGVNVVEREGISAWHPSRFLLVGTMNPEEGELRPQLLDRFGLCVDVIGLRHPDDRVAIMQRHQQPSPVDDLADLEIAHQVVAARGLLPQVTVPRAVVQTAAAIAVDQRVVGHRADLVMFRAARARRALRAASEVSPESLEVSLQDLIEVSELVLVHRRRSSGGTGIPSTAGDSDAAPGSADQSPPVPTEGESGAAAADPGATGEEGGSARQSDENGGDAEQAGAATAGSPGPAGTVEVEVEQTVPVGRIQLPRERLRRHGSGRRSQTASRDRRGRYVGSTVVEKTTDLALDATLRAAAPHQRHRRTGKESEGALAIRLEPRDLRQKVRQRRVGNLIVFLVDASASMDAEQRMDATRSAILALLKDAYVRRDRVAMISFSGRSARTVLRPTASVDLAERQLTRLAVGGTTPLTHGLVAALEMVRAERMRDPEVLPLLVLISDGRGNISLRGEEPLIEAQQAGAMIRTEQVRALVIDSAHDHLPPQPRASHPSRAAGAQDAGNGFNACADLADRMGAQYFGLFDISEQGILQPVAAALRR
ncbi:MAG: VWA domain-containing protein [Candidatus Dormibacteria bacterium]